MNATIVLSALLMTSGPKPAAAAGKLREITASVDKKMVTQKQLDAEGADNGGGDDDCGKVTFTASSTLAPDGKAHYDASALGDGKLSTAWCEGVPGFGVGESVTVEIHHGHAPWNGYLQLMNGYAAGGKLYKSNGRPKTLKVSLDGKPLALVHLTDTLGRQSFSLQDVDPNFSVPEEGKVTLEIVEVYSAGAKSQDTCISDINVLGCPP